MISDFQIILAILTGSIFRKNSTGFLRAWSIPFCLVQKNSFFYDSLDYHVNSFSKIRILVGLVTVQIVGTSIG